MPTRDSRQRVQDMLEAVQAIQRHLESVGWERFQDDPVLQGDIMWRFTILGEAVAHIDDEFKARHSEVPWRDIRGLRNVLTHMYFGIDLIKVWRVVQDDLPPLKRQLRSIVDREANADESSTN